VASALGCLSTFIGFAKYGSVPALNTIGVVGFFGLFLGGVIVFSSDFAEDLWTRLIWGLTVAAVVIPLSGLLFLFGRPLDEDERTFNILTIMGVVTLGALLLAIGMTWQEWVKRNQPATKTCPDCANHVLAAARKCQHCGFRFDSEATTTG